MILIRGGIDTFTYFTKSVNLQTLASFKEEELCREDFNSTPFINADGYIVRRLLILFGIFSCN